MGKNKGNYWRLIFAASTTAFVASNVVFAAPDLVKAKFIFSDINDTDYFYNDVMNLLERGVINGYSDGTFRPNEYVTRGQASKMIAGILGLESLPNTNSNFNDVPKEHQYFDAIASLKNAGIIDGYEDGTFRPNEPIIRNHMAKIIANAFHLTSTNTTKLPFKDVRSNYQQAVISLFENNITTGKTETIFDGEAFVTRGQLAAFLVRAERATNEENIERFETFKISEVMGDFIQSNGVQYRISPNVKNLININNAAALKDAEVRAKISNNEILDIQLISFRNQGQNSKTTFDGQNSNFNGELVIDSDNIEIKNLVLNGNIVLTEKVDHSFTATNITSTGNLIIETDKVSPTASINTTVEKSSNNPSLYLGNSIFKNIQIERNNIIINSDIQLPQITIQNHISNTTINSKVLKLLINFEGNLELKGTSTIEQLIIEEKIDLNILINGFIKEIYLQNNAIKLSLNSNIKIENIYIPENASIQTIIENYNQFMNNISKVVRPGISDDRSNSGGGGSSSSYKVQVEQFKKIYSTILNKNLQTIALEDEGMILAGISEYEGLREQAQKLLIKEKELLDTFLLRISLLKEVNQFKTKHHSILNKEKATVSLLDEENLNAALIEFEQHSAEQKENLVEEKKLLDELKLRINVLKEANQFITTHQEVLTKDVASITIPNESAVYLALLGYEELSIEAKNELINEKTLLEQFLLQIELLKVVEQFKVENSEILSKNISDISLDEETIVKAALVAYEELSIEAKAYLITEKQMLEDFLYKINVLKEINQYLSTYKELLNKDLSLITLSDEENIKIASLAYENLSEEAKAALVEEKKLLEDLYNQILVLKEVHNYKINHSVILEKQIQDVEIGDEPSVNLALTAFENLSVKAKSLLEIEKILLDSMLSKILVEKEVNEFLISFDEILTESPNTITLEKENEVNRAINEYEKLSEGAKTFLTEQKQLLDSILAEIIVLKELKQFRENYEEVLLLDENSVMIDDETMVTSALNAYGELSNDAQARLTIEKGLLDALYSEISVLKEVSQFEQQHSVILSRDPSTIVIDDEETIISAIAAYESLSSEAKIRLTDKKAILDELFGIVNGLIQETALESDIAKLEKNYFITSDGMLVLPSIGEAGSSIIWSIKTDEANVVSLNGNKMTIKRSSMDDINDYAVLEATLTNGRYTETVSVNIEVTESKPPVVLTPITKQINSGESVNLSFSEPLSEETKTDIENMFTNSTVNELIYDWTSETILKITNNGEEITAFNQIVSVDLKDLNGNSTLNAKLFELPSVESIEITHLPWKTTYIIGEEIDLAGLTVRAIKTDQSTDDIPISKLQISGFDSETAGSKTITVVYEGKEATFTVDVVQQLISKTITSYDFATIPGTTAKLESKPVETYDFRGNRKEFVIVIGEERIPIYVDWMLSTDFSKGASMGSVVESHIQQYYSDKYGTDGFTIRALYSTGSNDTFTIGAFQPGSASSFHLEGPDWSYFFEIDDAQGLDPDHSKNRSFTVSDGNNTATIQLSSNLLSMDRLVSTINSQLSNAKVNAQVLKVDDSHFKIISSSEILLVNGDNFAEFFE